MLPKIKHKKICHDVDDKYSSSCGYYIIILGNIYYLIKLQDEDSTIVVLLRYLLRSALQIKTCSCPGTFVRVKDVVLTDVWRTDFRGTEFLLTDIRFIGDRCLRIE